MNVVVNGRMIRISNSNEKKLNRGSMEHDSACMTEFETMLNAPVIEVNAKGTSSFSSTV